MRITFNSSTREPLADLQRAASQMATYQRQVASGKRIHRPSDDPAASAAAIGVRAEIATLDRYEEAGDTADARLRAADAILSDIVTQITAAQVAVQAGRGSVATPAQREAAAAELEAVSDAIFSDIGANLGGSFLFSGTASTTPPYARTGGAVSAYQGNDTGLVIDLDRNVSVQVSFDAREITAPGGTDVFAILGGLASAVRGGDETAIQAGLDQLGPVFDAAVRAQSRVGNALRTIDSQRDRLETLNLASERQVSALEDVNMATALSGLANSETVYRSALGAIGAAARLSLLDYLK